MGILLLSVLLAFPASIELCLLKHLGWLQSSGIVLVAVFVAPIFVTMCVLTVDKLGPGAGVVRAMLRHRFAAVASSAAVATKLDVRGLEHVGD